MSESNYGELLSAYLDGEVEGEELNRVNLLLASSPEARQELERLQDTKHSLATATRMSAPPDLVALLLANPKLHRKQPTSWLSRILPQGMPRLALASAFAAVLAIGTAVTLKAPWSSQPLPLESLLAAHGRQVTNGGVHTRIMAASGYTALLANQNETHP
jgi:anti-sigma factor RsiW